MQVAGGGAVLVVKITAYDNAEAFDVEECVLDFQWIKGPSALKG